MTADAANGGAQKGFQPGDQVMAEARDGDQVRIDRYLSGALDVVRRWTTLDGVIIMVESGGGTTYRMRAVDDDDDRLLLEKRDGKNWEPHIRVHADLVTEGDD